MPFRTKRELAIGNLREAISSGRYHPGQTLRQTQLVQDLGLGSTPVREAVLELLARGVLVQESHHSVRVAELDLERLGNLYRVRALLETEAARLGTARIDDGSMARMRDLLREMRQAKTLGRIDLVAQSDAAFHGTLYRASGNPILIDLIEQVGMSFPGNILWNIPGRIARSLDEHGRILAAIEQRDPTAAGFAVENHLLSALAALEGHVSAFSKRAPPREPGPPSSDTST